MQHYLNNDAKLKKFVPIIHDSVVYPVILDANRTVLSLPPIINGAHSAVRMLHSSSKHISLYVLQSHTGTTYCLLTHGDDTCHLQWHDTSPVSQI